MERYFELSEETPFSDEVQNQYNLSDERIQNANYRVDCKPPTIPSTALLDEAT